MDNIFIKGIEVYAYHGVLNEEKKLGQKFIVDIDMEVDLSEASYTDDLNKTINYAEVASFTENFMIKNCFNLIETAAGRLARELLINFRMINQVSVVIKKPSAPVKVRLDCVSVKVARHWNEVFLGIGSNIGDKKKNIDEAIRIIREDKLSDIISISDMIITKPVGYTEQDDFLNGAIKIKTLRTPQELLELIEIIEKELERVRTIHWGPRTIDVDILFYNDEVIREEKLIIPHKEIQNREFVLKPLCQISPEKVHPVYNKNMMELYQEFKNN